MSDYEDLVNTFLKNGGEIKKGKPMKRTKGISVQKMHIDAQIRGDYKQWQKGEDSYEKYQNYLKRKDNL